MTPSIVEHAIWVYLAQVAQHKGVLNPKVADISVKVAQKYGALVFQVEICCLFCCRSGRGANGQQKLAPDATESDKMSEQCSGRTPSAVLSALLFFVFPKLEPCRQVARE